MQRFAILALLAVVAVAGCTTQIGGGGTGRAVFAISDTAANLNSVSSIKMTVNSVSAHSAQGWVSLTSQPRTYDLLELRSQGNAQLLADARIPAGTYDQMRLDVSSIAVIDSTGAHQARLPSGEFKVVGQLDVAANSTSTATFDFLADHSLHVTGNGQYIFAPVAQVETRSNANAEVSGDNRVTVSGGSVRSSARVGMGIDGNVGVGVEIPADAELSIGATGLITLGRGVAGSAKGSLVASVADTAADMGAVTSVKVTVDRMSAHSDSAGWVTVSSSPRTFDLLQLKADGTQALLVNTTIEPGTYQQVRLDISNVMVTDANGTHQAKLPSGELKIVANLVVNAGQTATAAFDFMADQSLHVTGNGQYIFAPVVRLETRENAVADAQANSRVSIRGGVVDSDTTVGMDANGNVGVGVRIPANAKLSITGSGGIGSSGGVGY